MRVGRIVALALAVAQAGYIEAEVLAFRTAAVVSAAETLVAQAAALALAEAGRIVVALVAHAASEVAVVLVVVALTDHTPVKEPVGRVVPVPEAATAYLQAVAAVG